MALLAPGEKVVLRLAVTPSLVREGCLHAGLVGECETGCLREMLMGLRCLQYRGVLPTIYLFYTTSLIYK